MNLLKNLFLFSLLSISALFISCGDDDATFIDCTVNGCPAGFTCQDGVCVQDASTIDCTTQGCPAGFTCENGVCVQDGCTLISSNITADATWTTGNCYILGGRITVVDGVTLTIEPGVIIKGEAGTGANATALWL